MRSLIYNLKSRFGEPMDLYVSGVPVLNIIKGTFLKSDTKHKIKKGVVIP